MKISARNPKDKIRFLNIEIGVESMWKYRMFFELMSFRPDMGKNYLFDFSLYRFAV